MAKNAPVRLVDPHDQDRLEAGDCYFVRRDGEAETVGLVHACPCGCGGRSALFFRGKGAGRQEWDVIGEWPRVTLTPSIGVKYDADGKQPERGGYHWHGYLRDGVFVEG